MRRLLLIGAAATGLAVAGLAVGATEHQVTLTATAIQPANAQVGWGDTIVFTNTDSAQHTLLIPRLQLTKEIPAGSDLDAPLRGVGRLVVSAARPYG